MLINRTTIPVNTTDGVSRSGTVDGQALNRNQSCAIPRAGYRAPIGGSLAITVLFAATIPNVVPLKDLFIIAGDESFEVAKAYLMSNGASLSTELWNDQPPLHTWFMSLLFSEFGPSIELGRVLSCLAGGLLLGSTFFVGSMLGSLRAGFIAALSLLGSPFFLELACAMMLEVPALSLAALSLAIFAWAQQKASKFLHVTAALLFGAALATKLTALSVAPAFVLLSMFPNGQRSLQGAIKALFFLAVAALSFLSITLPLTHGHFSDLFAGHFHASVRGNLTPQELWPASLAATGQNLPLFLAAGFYTLRLLWQPKQKARGPCVWFAVVFLALIVHRPGWYYYILHLSLPCALVVGLGLDCDWRSMLACGADKAKPLSSNFLNPIAPGLVVLLLITGWVVNEEIHRLRALPRTSESKVLEYLAFQGAKSLFTDVACLGVYLRATMIPELAVLHEKRVRTRSFTDEAYATLLRKYKPEVIALRGTGWFSEQSGAYVSLEYRFAASIEGIGIWTRKRPVNSDAPSRTEQSRSPSF